MIDLRPHPDGVVVPVRALAGARQDGLRGVHAGALKLSVTQVAEKGKANRALAELLARLLQVRKSQVQLLTGATAAQKQFLVREADLAQLRSHIQRMLSQADPRPGKDT